MLATTKLKLLSMLLFAGLVLPIHAFADIKTTVNFVVNGMTYTDKAMSVDMNMPKFFSPLTGMALASSQIDRTIRLTKQNSELSAMLREASLNGSILDRVTIVVEKLNIDTGYYEKLVSFDMVNAVVNEFYEQEGSSANSIAIESLELAHEGVTVYVEGIRNEMLNNKYSENMR